MSEYGGCHNGWLWKLKYDDSYDPWLKVQAPTKVYTTILTHSSVKYNWKWHSGLLELGSKDLRYCQCLSHIISFVYIAIVAWSIIAYFYGHCRVVWCAQMLLKSWQLVTVLTGCQWELSWLCHVSKNNHLIIFTTVYYGLLGGHLRMGALLVCFMNCPPNSN